MLNLVSIHNLCDHFGINHYLIHFIIEHVHLLSHFGWIEIVHLLISQVS
jgi:hypothetical protein